MNGLNLTKFCILIITDKIYVGIGMYFQFFKNSYTLLLIDVLTFFYAPVDVNDQLYEQEISLLRPYGNFASIKEGFFE